jgi:hypothetical protein
MRVVAVRLNTIMMRVVYWEWAPARASRLIDLIGTYSVQQKNSCQGLSGEAIEIEMGNPLFWELW